MSSALPLADDSHLPSKKRKKPPSPPDPAHNSSISSSGVIRETTSVNNVSSIGNEESVTTCAANNIIVRQKDPPTTAAASSSSSAPALPAASLPRSSEEGNPSTKASASVPSTKTTMTATRITTTRSNISPSRLPSKKRKGSQDSSYSQQTSSTTHSACVQFEDDVKGQRRRNDSTESTITTTSTQKAVEGRLKPSPPENSASAAADNMVIAATIITTTTTNSSSNTHHGDNDEGAKRNDAAENAMPSSGNSETNKTANDDDDDDETPPRGQKRKFSSEENNPTALCPRKDSAGSAAGRDRLGSFSAPNDLLLYGTLHHGEESTRVRLDSISALLPSDDVVMLPNILHHGDESTSASVTTARARLDSFYAPSDLLSAGSLHGHELQAGGGGDGGGTKRKDSADSAASRTKLGSFSEVVLTSGSVNNDEAKGAGKQKGSADNSTSSLRARLHSFSVQNDVLSGSLMPNSDDSRARKDSLESITARSRMSSSSMNEFLVNALLEGVTTGQQRKDSGADSQAAKGAIRSRKTSSTTTMDPPPTAPPPALLQQRSAGGRPRTRTNSVSSLENEEESLKQQRKMSHDSSISASSPHLGITHDSTTDTPSAAAASQQQKRLLVQQKGELLSATELPSGSFEDVADVSLPLRSHLAGGPSFEEGENLPLPPPPSHEPLAPLELSGPAEDDATLTPTMSNDSSKVKTSKSGNASGGGAAAAALEHLDVLGGELSGIEKEAAAVAAAAFIAAAPTPASSAAGTAGVVAMPKSATAKGSQKEEDDQSSAGTQTSSGNQRLLYEAIMMTAGSGWMAAGGGAATAPGGDAHHGEGGVITGRERFESIGSFLDVAASFRNRDRLESWGGMSDLSLQLGGGGSDPNRPAWLHGAGGASSANAAAVAAPAAATEANAAATGLPSAMDDADLLDMFPEPARSVPSRISMERDRLNSIASLSDASFTGFPIVVDGVDMTLDVQAFVAAAMASVGDQLAELAGAVESAASLSGSTAPVDITAALAPLVENAAAAHRRDGDDSETSSAAEPMIGAALEGGIGGAGRGRRRPRSWSTSSGRISVDYEAVAQAVDAAHAATGALDLASIANSSSEGTGAAATPAGDCSRKEKPRRTRRQLPLKRAREESEGDRKVKSAPTSKVQMSDEDIDQIRERARAAAGYVPPQSSSKKQAKEKASVPLKKRAKRPSPNPDRTKSNKPDATPKISNRTARSAPAPENAPSAPLTLSADVTTSCKQTKGQTNQKWDSMFECLVEFIDERRTEETTGQSEEDKNAWVWDGNVPTTHKAKDGKALGRWVNNQRSAKSKGALKGERQHRLESVGLKWSVMVSNAWNDALGELQKYIDEQRKAGKEWDGNVPTSYQIKSCPNGGGPQGEDRNLGRWVNRQRSLYQSGKLRKDRQLALEKMGLKWSMLASTSWESMYETFLDYIQQKKTSGVGGSSEWDGNVPATYRTNDNPPRGLGRWINRQRSAYKSNSLKKEYVDKLNSVGLKWSVHERGSSSSNDKQGGEGIVEADNVGSCHDQKKSASIINNNGPLNGMQGECKADNVGSSDVERKPPASITKVSSTSNKQDEDKASSNVGSGGDTEITKQVPAAVSVTNGSSSNNDTDCEDKANNVASGNAKKKTMESKAPPISSTNGGTSNDIKQDEQGDTAASVTKGEENSSKVAV